MRHAHTRGTRFRSPEFSPDGRFLRTQRTHDFYIWSVPPRMPEGLAVPEWLLQLATVFATMTINTSGQLVDLPDAITQFQDLRRQIAALPVDAPLADWGRWIMDERADRSIAPGFTVTKTGAAQLAAILTAEVAPAP